jgi:predicted DCC family thiol-disulfide oxidoreductase YuxK
MNRQLATPDERPSADVVIYDGQCPFCTAQVQRLAALDRGKRLAYLSLHDASVLNRYPGLTREDLLQQMYVIDQHGNRYRGAGAIRHLTTRLPALWGVAPLLHIPGSLPIWQWLYRQVARRRYRRMGRDACKNDACRIHFR